jgi:hypothetical protein
LNKGGHKRDTKISAFPGSEGGQKYNMPVWIFILILLPGKSKYPAKLFKNVRQTNHVETRYIVSHAYRIFVCRMDGWMDGCSDLQI